MGMFLLNFAKLNTLENLKNWLDVLCFCPSGISSDGTITAKMAMMMGKFYNGGATMDCPVGGARSIVDALVRGIDLPSPPGAKDPPTFPRGSITSSPVAVVVVVAVPPRGDRRRCSGPPTDGHSSLRSHPILQPTTTRPRSWPHKRGSGGS